MVSQKTLQFQSTPSAVRLASAILRKLRGFRFVVEDHLLVEIAEIGHQAKIFRASSIAAASVSSSARVL